MDKQQKYYSAFSDIVEKFFQFYPFLSTREANNFKRQANASYCQIKKISNDEEFLAFAKEFIASLGHSHAKIVGKTLIYRPKDCQVKYINSKFYLFKSGKLVGELITIDSQAPRQILRSNQKYISASTPQYLMAQGLERLFNSDCPKSVVVKVRTKDGVKAIKLSRLGVKPKKSRAGIKWRFISGKVGYLKIGAWRFSNFDDKRLEKIINKFLNKKINKIIIDVRGNGGGRSKTADGLAGHFLNKKIKIGKSLDRFNHKTDYFVLPKRPFVKASVIILVDNYCLSSTELFVAGLKDNKLAFVIGQTTGGGTGNPKKFEIALARKRLNLYVPTWVFYRRNREMIEGRGIKPDIEIDESVGDLSVNNDFVLERAVSFLLNKKG